MKNITLSADEELIEAARNEAREKHTTLNQMFRGWLEEIAKQRDRERNVDELMQRLSYVRSGGPFTREDMNER